MLCNSKDEMLDPNMILVSFWQSSSMIQESLNLSQLPSPDEGLVFYQKGVPSSAGGGSAEVGTMSHLWDSFFMASLKISIFAINAKPSSSSGPF